MEKKDLWFLAKLSVLEYICWPCEITLYIAYSCLWLFSYWCILFIRTLITPCQFFHFVCFSLRGFTLLCILNLYMVDCSAYLLMVSSIGSWLKQNAFHWVQCTGLIFILQSGSDCPACNEERASSFCTGWSGTAQAKGDSTPAPLPAPGCGVSSTWALFSTLDENCAVALL